MKVKVEFTHDSFFHSRRVRAGTILRIDREDMNPSMMLVDDSGDRVTQPKTRDNMVQLEVQQKTIQRRHGQEPALQASGKPAAKQVPAMDSEDRVMSILKALNSLDHDRDDQWTQAGMPRVKVIEALVGFDVTQAEILEHAVKRRAPEEEVGE